MQHGLRVEAAPPSIGQVYKRVTPATMRYLFICTLLCVLPIPALAETTPDWANRLTAKDPEVRAMAEAALVKGAGRSLPLLKRLLSRGDENLDAQGLSRSSGGSGRPAIPLLVELLRDEQVSFRRNAADSLIDLAPDTEWIQPALRRALSDGDVMVAGDAARALGALGPKASPSIGALVTTLSHRGSLRPRLRGGGPGVCWPEGGRRDQGPRRSLGGSHPRRPMGGG